METGPKKFLPSLSEMWGIELPLIEGMAKALELSDQRQEEMDRKFLREMEEIENGT